MRLSPPASVFGDDSPGLLHLYLDPRGRLSRRSYWLHGVLALCGLSIYGRAVLEIAHLRVDVADSIVTVVLLWPALAISAKRWHDRGRSAWWVLLALVPLIGWIWMLIDNGFVRGTPTANRYGAAPPR